MNKLLDAEDILTYARDHIECVSMAAGQLPHEQGTPIQVVADTASNKIEEAIALLNEYRESGDAPVPAPGAKPKSPPARPKRDGK